MTTAEVQARVTLLAAEQDNETFHLGEDRLYRDVLTAIAAGECDDAAACASAAIESLSIHRPRWYS